MTRWGSGNLLTAVNTQGTDTFSYSLTYDMDGNVTNILAVNATTATIDQFKYTYNSDNQLTAETDTQTGSTATTSYTYDKDGQLTGAGTVTYGYDSNGNRNTGSDTVGSDNEMSADATWTYQYDNNGNLTEKDAVSSAASWTYAYNSTNEMTEVKQYNTFGSLVQTVDYKYDAFGDMIEDAVTPYGGSTTTSLFAYDGWNPDLLTPIGNENMNVWAVTNGSGTLQTQYVWGDKVDQQLGRIDISGTNDTRWNLVDHLGSIRDVIDNTGTILVDIQYDAFGNITFGGLGGGWYGWTGQILDPATGLQNNHARWYDSTMGRWISQDPTEFDAGDSNLYRYVNNAPTDGTDPSGLQTGVPSPPGSFPPGRGSPQGGTAGDNLYQLPIQMPTSYSAPPIIGIANEGYRPLDPKAGADWDKGLQSWFRIDDLKKEPAPNHAGGFGLVNVFTLQKDESLPRMEKGAFTFNDKTDMKLEKGDTIGAYYFAYQYRINTGGRNLIQYVSRSVTIDGVQVLKQSYVEGWYAKQGAEPPQDSHWYFGSLKKNQKKAVIRVSFVTGAGKYKDEEVTEQQKFKLWPDGKRSDVKFVAGKTWAWSITFVYTSDDKFSIYTPFFEGSRK